MSDSKALLLPDQPSVPSSSAADESFYITPPTFEESQSGSDRPLIDVDVVPADPTAGDLELIVSPTRNKTVIEGDQDGDDESAPLLPPPDFSNYDAVYSSNAYGDIVSHDKHLNEDGEALYRFILSNASTTPTLVLKCRGTHTEWRTRQTTRYEDGKNVTSTETFSETIVDFDFTIDASSAILPEPNAPIWLVGDKDAAYRGRRKLEVDSPPKVVEDTGELVDVEAGTPRKWRRRATVSEQNASESWAKRREEYGYAPWVLIRGQIRGMEAAVESPFDRTQLANATHANTSERGSWFDDSTILPPSKTLRDWSDEYCASRRPLKEFTFRKAVYGWNVAALRQAVETTIRNNYFGGGATGSSDPVAVEFGVQGASISVKPDNWLSRLLDRTWVIVILCITLIYPLFIWPYKRFGARGGGEWRVAGSAFALTKYVHLQDSIAGETVDDYRRRKSKDVPGFMAGEGSGSSGGPMLKATPRGISQLVGQREGEWFAQWEETIIALVRQRYISDVPLTRPTGSVNLAAIGLDGYSR